MATKPITFSDLSGEMGADTVKFGLGADTWEIDLTDGEKEDLEQALTPFIEKARRAARPRPVKARSRDDEAAKRRARIREWAESQGLECPKNGKIPMEVEAAYKAGHAD